MGLQLRLRAETGASYKQTPAEFQRVPDVPIWENERAPVPFAQQIHQSYFIAHICIFDR